MRGEASVQCQTKEQRGGRLHIRKRKLIKRNKAEEKETLKIKRGANDRCSEGELKEEEKRRKGGKCGRLGVLQSAGGSAALAREKGQPTIC